MGDSLRSIGEWIALITFLAAVVAAANTRVQSPAIWICLGLWVAIVALYLLMKLIRAKVSLPNLRTGTYRKEQEQDVQVKYKGQHRKNTIVEGSIAQASASRKEAGFKLPPLAGFSVRRLQAITRKKAHQESSSSSQDANREADFELPPLAGFAPQRFQATKGKKPRQGSSPSQDAAENKGGEFDLPPLAGFAPQEQLQNKKPSPSQSYVPPGLPPELFLQ